MNSTNEYPKLSFPSLSSKANSVHLKRLSFEALELKRAGETLPPLISIVPTAISSTDVKDKTKQQPPRKRKEQTEEEPILYKWISARNRRKWFICDVWGCHKSFQSQLELTVHLRKVHP